MRVAIIGAGASGLAAIKCCLEEGLEPVCFEREDDIGGLWNYCEEPRPGKGSVYKSCTINTSKEMMAFSDFPVPPEFPPFMKHSQVLKYFRMYCEHFKLLEYIQFGTSVENVKPAEDFNCTARWEVTLRKEIHTDSYNSHTDVFDGVMVCTGHHVYPHIPDFRGWSEFKGIKMHSHDYKRPEPFADKKVLIVGIGNSAVDIAVDLSRIASQVHVSTRRGAWVISKMGPFGYPADALANSRFSFTLPLGWLQKLVECMANFRFNHKNYGLKPQHGALEAHPTINDDLPHRIMTGDVVIKSDVSTISSAGVTFTDGVYEDYDVIILATGYNYKYKFMDRSVFGTDNNEVPLYKYMFPPHLQHHTLAVIGLVQAIGAVIPISEIQSRWFTKVIKGEVSLPCKEEMSYNIYETQQAMREQFCQSQRHTLQAFWIQYMDDIAVKIGVRPSFSRLFFSDPFLALRCYFGPCVPAQYRLHGPGASPEAPSIIRKAFSNFHAGTCWKDPNEKAQTKQGGTKSPTTRESQPIEMNILTIQIHEARYFVCALVFLAAAIWIVSSIF